MKRVAVLAMVAVVIAGAATAEAATRSNGLQFSFTGLNTLGVSNIQTNAIGLKKAMGPDTYLLARFGLGINRSTTDGAANMTDAKSGGTNVIVGLGLQKNMPACNHLVPYVGGLVRVSRTSSWSEPSHAETVVTGMTTKTTSSTMTLGANGMVGGEYFVRDCLSLSGEYTFGFSFSTTKGETETHGQDTVETKTSGWNFGPFYTAGLWLTAYWD